MKNIIYLGIGSNLGDKKKNCITAINQIESSSRISRIYQSSFYKTEPVGVENQEWFINCAVTFNTALNPMELLKLIQKIELNLQRQRPYRWAPRTIDLDILFFDQEIINLPELIIPHPLLHKRRFALIPLEEINPELVHPVFKCTISELVKKLNSPNKVIKI